MKNLKSVLLILLSTGLSACMTENLENPGQGGKDYQVSSEKIINSPIAAQKGSLLIHVNEATASNPEALSALFNSDVCTSYERVFTINSLNEKRAQEYGLHRWYKISFDENSDIQDIAIKLSGATEIDRIEYNSIIKKASDCNSYQYYASATPKATDSKMNDPFLADQWHYHNTGDKNLTPTAKEGADINLFNAWNLTAGDPEIIVAVVDEAVQYNHPDLAANMWTNPGEVEDGQDNDGNGLIDDIHGWNFARADGKIDWSSPGSSGHGTHVAGTVAAVNGNNMGVAGVAGGTGHNDGVKIMCCQIFTGFDFADTRKTADAIMYAADKGAHILQCSWGIDAGKYTSDNDYRKDNSVMADAIDYFANKKNDILDGGIVVFASGNQGQAISSYPAAMVNCISVTGTAADGLPAFYTNYGPGCNIAAPGGEYCTGGKPISYEKTLVLSTMPTVQLDIFDPNGKKVGVTAKDYGYMQGTSMACPHVSGIAALGLSYIKKTGKKVTKDEFIAALYSAVNELNSRLSGVKESINALTNKPGSLHLTPYKNKMGTGSVDAWKFLMALEGTPCITVKYGSEQAIELKSIFGSDAGSLKYTGVTISKEDKEALGLSSDPQIKRGRLYINATKYGSAKLTVTAIAGGSSIGGGNSIGGSLFSKEISIIARNIANENGGWL